MSEQLTWTGPVEDDTRISHWHVWTTECGRYRVVRSTSKLRGGPAAFSSEWKRTKTSDTFGKPIPPTSSWVRCESDRDGQGREYRDLRSALESAYNFHLEKSGRAAETNADEVVRVAKKLGVAGLADRPPGDSKVTEQAAVQKEQIVSAKTKILNVDRDQLVAMFMEMGLANAASFVKDKKKLRVKLKNLPTLLASEDPLPRPKTRALAKLLDQVLEAEDVVVVEAAPASDGAPGAELAKVRKKATPKEVAARPKPPKVAAKEKTIPRKRAEGMSMIDAAAKVLSEAKGKSLSTSEMIVLMESKGYWTSPGGKTPQNTLATAILRDKQNRFKRESPGKYVFNQ